MHPARIAAVLASLLAMTASVDANERSRSREASGAKGGISPELGARIDSAIDRAAVRLKTLLQTELLEAKKLEVGGARPEPVVHIGEGSFTHHHNLWAAGRVALYAHALVVGGVPPADPIIVESWNFLRDRPMRHTYEVAMTLLLRESMMHPPSQGGDGNGRVRQALQARSARAPRAGGNRDADWTQQAANWLASGCDGGTWNYFCPGGTVGYPTGDAPQQDYEISGSRDAPTFGEDLLRLTGERNNPRTDLSNTQYAVLGLKAASLLGAKPAGHSTMWRVIIAKFLQLQERTGPEVRLALSSEDSAGPDYTIGMEVDRARGWGYTGRDNGGPIYGSMTSCGLATMLIAQSEVEDLTADEQMLITQAARDGLAWFQVNWSVAQNLGADKMSFSIPAEAKYYYLYGLERCGVLANFRTIGGHNWYQEGAEHILPAQRQDGAWAGEGNMEIEGVRTAFAILFLARGTSTDYGFGGVE